MKQAVTVSDHLTFTLTSPHLSYIFYVEPDTGDLIHVYYGSPINSPPPHVDAQRIRGWSNGTARAPREFPDLGRGDFREPAFRIGHHGTAIARFRYADYKIIPGKPCLEGLPSTFASSDQATTLVVRLSDEHAKIDVFLSYTIFQDHPAIARSHRFVNLGSQKVTIEHAASFCVDLPSDDWDMVYLAGEWSRECQTIRRKVYPGLQGFESNTGYSSHLYNPFVAMVSCNATETVGDVYGINLIYSGAHRTIVDKAYNALTRVMIGLNPNMLSWPLEAGESFTTPEAVAIFSSEGLGSMSRAFHRLYRQHLARSKWTLKPRPTLLNNWEGTYFDFDDDKLFKIASSASAMGVKLFVMDDGWFGVKHPRIERHAGLGDWVPNPSRFPKGIKNLVDRVNNLSPKGDSKNMQFGIWVEPEMVNPASELYEKHPSWVLHSGDYPRTTQRYQLILNLALKEVQQYIISSVSSLLESANITYVKWDLNRGMHELPTASSSHAYMLGLYHVLEALTTRFPEVLFEGCASGGGRFDAGILQYWPQSWTSDNNDALDRLAIQFGTSMVYPASSMGGHIASVPSHQTDRITSLAFRAHVAMMCGSFGLELNPLELTEDDRASIPALIEENERLNPIIITGDQYRLALPSTNWPAVQYISEDKTTVALLLYQIRHEQHVFPPNIKLQGLDPGARYLVEQDPKVEPVEVDGYTLMRHGLTFGWHGDYQSRIVWMKKAANAM